MNDRGIQVLEQYELDVAKVWKGRGALIVESSQGIFRLLEYKGTINHLVYEEALLKYMTEHGFSLVNRIVTNKEEELFSLDYAGIKYILVKHFPGGECDVKNWDDVCQAVKTLANLHCILEHADLDGIEYIPELPDSMEELQKHNRELKRIRTFIRGKTRKTDFEYEVLAHFEEYNALGLEAEQKLRTSGYQEAERRAVERGDICHGNYNYHNIIHHGNYMAVINFEHSGKGIPIRDLYFFLRKVMEKYDWNIKYGQELIGIYDHIRPISEEELQILKILLSYPEKFWKVLNHYYNSNKAYLPDQMKDKMKKVYAQQRQKNNFVLTF